MKIQWYLVGGKCYIIITTNNNSSCYYCYYFHYSYFYLRIRFLIFLILVFSQQHNEVEGCLFHI